jgi:hypothetical protein
MKDSRKNNLQSVIEIKNNLRKNKASMPIEWKVKQVAEMQKFSIQARPISEADDTRMVWNAD